MDNKSLLEQAGYDLGHIRHDLKMVVNAALIADNPDVDQATGHILEVFHILLGDDDRPVAPECDLDIPIR